MLWEIFSCFMRLPVTITNKYTTLIVTQGLLPYSVSTTREATTLLLSLLSSTSWSSLCSMRDDNIAQPRDGLISDAHIIYDEYC